MQTTVEHNQREVPGRVFCQDESTVVERGYLQRWNGPSRDKHRCSPGFNERKRTKARCYLAPTQVNARTMSSLLLNTVSNDGSLKPARGDLGAVKVKLGIQDVQVGVATVPSSSAPPQLEP